MWKKRNNNTKKNVKGGEIKKRIKKRRKIEEREKVVNRGEVGEGERRCRRGAEEERRGAEEEIGSVCCALALCTECQPQLLSLLTPLP